MLRLVLPLMSALKLQNNGPLCSSVVIGMLAIDDWAVCYIWYREEVPGHQAPLTVPNVTAHPLTASVPTHII